MSKILFLSVFQRFFLGARLLAAHLNKHGHDSYIVSLKGLTGGLFEDLVENHHSFQVVCNCGYIGRCSVDIYSITDNELNLLKKCIADYNPDIIAFSTFSVNTVLLPQLMPVLTAFSPSTLLVAGGIGPTIEPEIFLEAGFDVAMKGEGEEALLELVNAYENKIDMLSIPNTIWKTKDGYKNNPMRAMCFDISSYPPPLYGHSGFAYIENDEIQYEFDLQKNDGSYCTLLGRGCVGKCTYCCGGQLTDWHKIDSGQPVRRRRNRTLESIFAELKSINLEDYGYFYFQDDLVTLSNSKLRLFFTWYKKEIDKPFWMYLPYAQLLENPDIFQLAIDAGWCDTAIGIQTGSEDFAKKYYHRNAKNTTYIAYAKLLFSADITVNCQFIGGNCYETEEDFYKTIDLIRQLPFSINDLKKMEVVCARLLPLPKTPLLEMCPRVLTDPMPVKEWYREAMLMILAQIVSKDTFDELYNNKSYYDNPLELRSIYYSKIETLQLEYYEDLLEKWKSKRIIFYGVSDYLINNYKFFKRFNPECILFEKEFMPKRKTFLKLPIYTREDFLPISKDTHVLVFSNITANLSWRIATRLGLQRNQINICSNSNIILRAASNV